MYGELQTALKTQKDKRRKWDFFLCAFCLFVFFLA